MLRVKDVTPKADLTERQKVAEFFGVPIEEVLTEPQPNTYSIMLADNEAAQAKYKEINPFGNAKRPGLYNFTQRVLSA
jgi:hypothetical protein